MSRIVKIFVSVSFILICAIVYCSCDASLSSNSQAATASADDPQIILQEFYNLLSNKNYGQAYTYLSENTKSLISSTAFISKHERIFDGLEISSIELNIISAQSNPLYNTFEFSLTYKSDLIEELHYEYTADLVYYQSRWTIEWTPSLLFPNMDWGDKIRILTTSANRGEIFASGKLVAQNSNGTSVYCVPGEIEDRDQFISNIAPYIQQSESEVRASLEVTKLMASVSVERLYLRQQPSVTTGEIITQLGQSDELEVLDDGKLYSSLLDADNGGSENASFSEDAIDEDFFYHVRVTIDNSEENKELIQTLTQNSPSNQIVYEVISSQSIAVEGYVYADYITLYYSQDVIVLKSYPPGEWDDSQRALILDVPGAFIDETGKYSTYRTYPYGSATFHIVGYVDRLSGEGQLGIESAYEQLLSGTPGYEVAIVNQDGATKETLYQVSAVNGKDVHLTIDPDLQLQAYNLMRLYLKDDETGAVIVNNPLDGSVLACVSYPSVDPNTFYSMSNQEWVYLTMEDPIAPLYNRAIQGKYTPGSVIKPFIAVVALESGAISTNSVFPYAEYIEDNKWLPETGQIPSGTYWDSTPITRVENLGGQLDFENAMLYSDNIFFAWAAMQTGKDAMLNFLHDKMGFETSIPFELHVNSSTVFNQFSETSNYDNFSIVNLADTGYGQGELQMTPLHLATMFTAFANDGDVMTPYIVDHIEHTEGIRSYVEETTEPSVWIENVISDPYVKKSLSDVLEKTMTEGTGRNVGNYTPYRVAGKTGTAQIQQGGKKRNVASVAAYKSESPCDYNILVTIECDVDQGSARMPIMLSLFNYDYDKDHLETTDSKPENMEQSSISQETEEELEDTNVVIPY